MAYAKSLNERYSPLYFLSSLGAGGLAVSFFMYLMWMTPHPGQPIPSFTTLSQVIATGNIVEQALVVGAALGILFFTFLHFRLMAWNFRELKQWKALEAYNEFSRSNAESQLMAIPLTLAMSVNVLFIIGAVFVPQLWENAEYLFPGALLAFGAIGVYAFQLFSRFLTRVFTEGGFTCVKNNSFAQMISVFALSMVGVGFSASAAMSHNAITSATGFFLSVLFIAPAILFGLFFLMMGFRSMMENGANEETIPTFWIIIPIITVIGIALYRLNMALDHNFGVEWLAGSRFAFLTFLFAIQLGFGALGYVVMKKIGYFENYLKGDRRSPGAYALICPGVALFVFANFLINPGLVGLGVLDKFSLAWFAMYAPLVVLQAITIVTFLKLNRKLLAERPASPSTGAAVPAE